MSTTTAGTATDILAARAAITTFIEPGDGTAGALINALGPVAAFETLTSSGDRHAALVEAGIGAAEARDALTRWLPRLRNATIEQNRADIERTGITVIDPDTIPALADLGQHRPVALYVRGNAAALAGGVDRAYPVGHSELFGRIADRGGALVSETPIGTAPTKWRFLARGRILAALSRATVVVEAGWRSGSLNTAGHAAALGRPLGAVPGPVTSAASAGCHRLLREHGAVAITGAADVLALLGD